MSATLLTIDNTFATARISLFGAQVLGFCPKHDGRERLFLSSKALLDGSKSIRGGVPVCWPWFGWRTDDPRPDGKPSPAHGFARTRPWFVEHVGVNDGGRIDVETRLGHGTTFTVTLPRIED